MKNSFTNNSKILTNPELIDMVNHELKSPLVNIKITAEILQRANKNLNQKFLTDSLKTINSKVDCLTQLINDFTDLVKLQSQNLVFKDDKYTLDQIIKLITNVHKDLIINEIPKTTKKISVDGRKLIQTISGLINVIPKLSFPEPIISLSIFNRDDKFQFYLYGLKENQSIDKFNNDHNQLLNNNWHQKENDRINTLYAFEFFQFYKSNFSIFYRPKIGVILYFELHEH